MADSNDEVLIKVAADIASAVASLGQLTSQMADLVGSITSVQTAQEQGEATTKSFWDTWTQGVEGGTASGVLWGNLMSNALTQLGQGFKDALLALPNVLSGAADLGDELGTMASRINVSVESLSELRYIASQSGASMEGLARVLSELQAKIAGGDSDLAAKLGEIGLKLEDLKNLDPTDQMFKVIEAIQATVEPSQQSAKSIEILGAKFRTSTMLLREDVGAMRARFKELGLEISTDFAKAGDQYNDTLDDMSKVQEKFKNDIASALLPTVNSLMAAFPSLGGAALTAGTGLFSFAESMIPMLTNMVALSGKQGIAGLATSVAGFLPSMTALRSGFAALGGPVGMTIAGVTLLAPLVYELIGGWDGLVSILSTVGNALSTVWKFLSDLATIAVGVASAVGTVMVAAFQAIWKYFTELPVVAGAFKLVSGAIEIMAGIVLAAFHRVQELFGVFRDALSWIGEKTHAAAEGFRGVNAAAQESVQASEQVATSNIKVASALDRMNAALVDAQEKAKSLDATERKHILTLLEAGEKVDDVAAAYKVSAAAIEIVKKETKDHEEAQRKGTAALKEAEEFIVRFNESIQKNREEIKKTKKELSDFISTTNQKIRVDGDSLNDVSRILQEKYTGPIVQAVTEATTNIASIYRTLDQTARSSYDQKVRLIQQQEAAEIQYAQRRKGVTAKMLSDEIAAITAKYEDERRMLDQFTGNVVRDAELRGVKTREVLAREVVAAQAFLDEMLANRSLFTEQAIEKQRAILEAAKEAARGESTAWKTAFGTMKSALDELSGALANLSEIGGNMGWLGNLVGGMSAGADAGVAMKGAVTGIGDGGAKSAAGVLQMVSALAAMKTALDAATQATGEWESALSGAATGASIGGAAGGGWGAAFGAIVGAMYGYIQAEEAAARSGREQARRVYRDWGVTISEEVGQLILAAEVGWSNFEHMLDARSRRAAELLNLDRIIGEAGGLSSKNIGIMTDRLLEVAKLLDDGYLSAEQAQEIFKKNFDSYAAYFLQTGQVAAVEFEKLFALADKLKIDLSGFVESQLSTIGAALATQLAGAAASYDGLGARVAAARQKVDELTEAHKLGRATTEQLKKAQDELAQALEVQSAGAKESADDVERIGRLAVASFNAAIAKGADWLTAINSIGPALDQIIQLQTDLGLEADSSAAKELIRFRNLTKEHKDLFEAAGGLNEVMIAMASIGALNEETLADLEKQGLDTFEQLKAAGLDENQALAQMKGWLQNVEKAHKDLGIPIDENTQKLIDQAREQGILAEEGMDTNSILMDGIGALIEAVGGTLPEAWQRMGRAGREAASKTGAEVEEKLKPKVDEVSDALDETKWTEYAERGVAAAGDIGGETEELVDSFARIDRQIRDTDWSSWGSELAEAAREAGSEVDAVSLGHSPGGLKEIPIKVKSALRAFRDFEKQGVMSAKAVGKQIDALSASSVAMATASDYATRESANQTNTTEVHTELSLNVSVDPSTGETTIRTDEGQVLAVVKRGLANGKIQVPVHSLTQRVN